MAETIADMLVRIGADTDRFERGMKSVQKTMEKTAGKMKTLSKGLNFTGIASGITAAASSIVPAAGAATAAVGALGSSMATAGVGAAAFGAVAQTTLGKVFEASEQMQELNEKVANADSVEERIKAQKELAEVYAGMSEEQRKAQQELQSFKEFWNGFTRQFEKPIFEAFTNSLEFAKSALSALEPTISGVAGVIRDFTADLNNAFKNGEMKEFFNWINDNATRSLSNFIKILSNVGGAFINLLQAFAPLSVKIEGGLVKMTERFNEWSKSMKESDGFKKFIEYATTNGPKLIGIVGNILKVLGNVVVQLAPLGSVVLTVLDGVTSVLSNLSSKLGGLIDGLVDRFSVFSGKVNENKQKIISSFQQMWENIKQALVNIQDSLQSLVDLIVVLWSEFGDELLSVWQTVWKTVSQVFENVTGILSGILDGIVGMLTGDWERMAKGLKSVWKNLWEGIGSILKGAWNILKTAFGGLGRSISKWFKNLKNDAISWGEDILNGLISGISNKLQAAKNKALEVASGIKNAITDFFIIQSPSKLMRNLGGFIPEGLAQGIDDGKKFVVNSAGNLVETTKKVLDGLNSWSSTQREFGGLSLKEELAVYDRFLNTYETNEMTQAKIKEKAEKIKEQIRKEGFEKTKKWLDEQKYYNKLTLEEELAAWQGMQRGYKEGTEEREEVDREYYRVKQEITSKLKSLNNDYLESIEVANKKMKEEEKKLTDKYNEELESRTRSLTNFAGIFEEIPKETEVTGKKLLNNLKDQVDYFKDWQTNIGKLVKKGVDEELLKQLEGMGPKAGKEIQALTRLSEKELYEYNKLWKEKNKLAKEQAIEELKPLKKETEREIKEIRRKTSDALDEYRKDWVEKASEITGVALEELGKMVDESPNLGKGVINSLIKGMEEKAPEVLAESTELGKNVMGNIGVELENTKGINEKVQGLASIIKNKIEEFKKVGEELGKGFSDSLQNSIKVPEIKLPNQEGDNRNGVTNEKSNGGIKSNNDFEGKTITLTTSAGSKDYSFGEAVKFYGGVLSSPDEALEHVTSMFERAYGKKDVISLKDYENLWIRYLGNKRIWNQTDDEKKKTELRKENEKLRKKYGFPNGDLQSIEDYNAKEMYKSRYNVYHNGGWVGKEMFKGLKLDEVPAILQKGEFVLSRKMISNIASLGDRIKNIGSVKNTQPQMAAGGGVSVNMYGDFHISNDMDIDRVANEIGNRSLQKMRSMGVK